MYYQTDGSSNTSGRSLNAKENISLTTSLRQDRQRDKVTERERETETDRQTNRQRQRKRDREIVCFSFFFFSEREFRWNDAGVCVWGGGGGGGILAPFPLILGYNLFTCKLLH